MNEEVGTLIREIPILYGETLDFRGVLFLIPSGVNYFNSWWNNTWNEEDF